MMRPNKKLFHDRVYVEHKREEVVKAAVFALHWNANSQPGVNPFCNKLDTNNFQLKSEQKQNKTV